MCSHLGQPPWWSLNNLRVLIQSPRRPQDPLSFINCSSSTCYTSTHLVCLAQHFLASDTTPCPSQAAIEDFAPRKRILPDRGRCPSCSAEVRWGDLIKGCYRRQNIHSKPGKPSVSESDQDPTPSHSEDEEQAYGDLEDHSLDESEGEDEIAALDGGKTGAAVRFAASSSQAGGCDSQKYTKKTSSLPKPIRPTKADLKPPAPVKMTMAKIQSSVTPKTMARIPDLKHQVRKNSQELDDARLEHFMKALNLKSSKPPPGQKVRKPVAKRLLCEEDEDEPEDEILKLMDDLQVSDDSD